MTTESLYKPIDFAAINRACLGSFDLLLRQWLPDGKRRGDEWEARNPTRADRRPGSFLINITRGVWADFATGDRGSDPVSLYAYLRGLSQTEAARELSRDWVKP